MSLPRILIVDDDPTVRQVCREALEQYGCEIHEAGDTARAIALLEVLSFSVVLSDVIMPGGNGTEILDHVVRHHPDTLVILLSGHGSIDVVKDAILKGAFDFLVKPFELSELTATIGRALEVRKKQTTELRNELYELHALTTSSSISTDTPESYLEKLCAALERSFRADAAAVVLEDGRLTLAGDDDILEDSAWPVLSRAASLLPEGSIMEPGSLPELQTPRGPAGAMCRPLQGKDVRIGSCIVVRLGAGFPFTERDLKLLGLFAAQAGNQLTGFDLARDLRETANDLEKINTISAGFSASLDTSKVLDAISKGLHEVIPFDVFGAFLSAQGAAPLVYVLSRADIPQRLLRSAFEERVADVTGETGFDKAWEAGIFQRFDKAGPPFDSAKATWFAFNLGEQGRLQGMLIAGTRDTGSLPGLQRYLSLLAGQAAVALGNAYLHQTGERNYIQTIAALAGAVDAKDPYTHYHSRNVTAYCLAMADYLGMPDREREDLRNAALLHDIGKIGMPEAILNKPGSLTSAEFDIIKTHPDIGYRILKPVTALADIPVTVRHHHERFDGGGYPLKLTGEDIPFHSRILAVADVFDAITSDRTYRSSPGLDYAVSELRSSAGTQLDPELVGAFLEILSERTPAEILSDYDPEVTR